MATRPPATRTDPPPPRHRRGSRRSRRLARNQASPRVRLANALAKSPLRRAARACCGCVASDGPMGPTCRGFLCDGVGRRMSGLALSAGRPAALVTTRDAAHQSTASAGGNRGRATWPRRGRFSGPRDETCRVSSTPSAEKLIVVPGGSAMWRLTAAALPRWPSRRSGGLRLHALPFSVRRGARLLGQLRGRSAHA